MAKPSIGELLAIGRDRLKSSASASLDVELLIGFCLGVSRVTVLTSLDRQLSSDEQASFYSLLSRRESGEPLAYLTGQREFYGLNFRVTPDVLIPRPETEYLVERAIKLLRPKDRMLDLGTGSGCIAVSIGRALHDLEIVATDLSERALVVAQQNALMNGVTRIQFHQGSWFDALPDERSFNLIVSNPPYIAPSEPVDSGLAFEPASALFAEGDGLSHVREILSGAERYLSPMGRVLVEVGSFKDRSLDALIASYKDRFEIEVFGDLETPNGWRIIDGQLL